jgi:HK97 family phage major capsid protein
MRLSDHLTDDQGRPLTAARDLSRAELLDELARWVADLETMAARGEHASVAFTARAERCALLDEQLERLDRLEPTRAQLRELAGLGQVERGAFGPATTTPRVPGNPLLVPGPGGTRVDDRDAVALRSGESLAAWGNRTGRLRGLDDNGLSFGRFIRGVVTGEWDGADAELRAASESPPSAGGFLVPTPLSSQIIDRSRAVARVMQAGATIVPMLSATQKVPKLVSAQGPDWRNENAPINDKSLVFDAVTLTARSLAAQCKISWELLDDASIASGAVEREFAAAFALEIDRVSLRGSGTPPEPQGLRGASGVTTTGGSGNGASPTWDLFLDGIQAIRAANYEPTAAIMNARTQTSLDKLREGGGATNAYLAPPPSLATLPRLLTNQIETNRAQGTSSDVSDIYLGDWSNLAIGVRIAMRVRVLTERYADTGQVSIMCDWRGDMQVLQGAAFQIITGVRP